MHLVQPWIALHSHEGWATCLNPTSHHRQHNDNKWSHSTRCTDDLHTPSVSPARKKADRKFACSHFMVDTATSLETAQSVAALSIHHWKTTSPTTPYRMPGATGQIRKQSHWTVSRTRSPTTSSWLSAVCAKMTRIEASGSMRYVSINMTLMNAAVRSQTWSTYTVTPDS